MEIFRTTRRVEFRDTDAAGIMHFSAYFTYMEEAEHELLRSVGTSVVTRAGDQTISWPRVAASCDFQSAVKFEDVVEIEVRITRLGTKSVTYGVRFTHHDRQVAVGSMTTVCCRILPNEPPQSLPIPESIASKLRAYVAAAPVPDINDAAGCLP